ncbi:hypothetical protein ACP4OV_001351 [Aristida adscensionis]
MAGYQRGNDHNTYHGEHRTVGALKAYNSSGSPWSGCA